MIRTTVFSFVVLLLLNACASAPKPRIGGVTPHLETVAVDPGVLIPSPLWPVRWGAPTPDASLARKPGAWVEPRQPFFATVLPVSPRTQPLLPLPSMQPLPVKATPLSRSWSTIAQAAKTTMPVPSAAPLIAAKQVKPVTKVPVPIPTTKPASPPTTAATSSLLPADTSTGSDFRWEDVNAVAGDSVTLHFDKTNWLYLDSPAQQKILGFQSVNRDKDATMFLFKPLVPGQYTLDFQRQDLVSQSTDLRKVKLTVAKTGTRTSTTGTTLSPQTSSTAANDALEASRLLAASGKTAEAVQKLLQSYRADDTRINLELARLLNQTGQDDEALSYLDKNLTFTGPDFDGTLELGTRLAASRDPQKKLPAYVKLWTTGTSAPPEDLYLQVFDTLRTQKMTALTKDWSTRYPSWYPAPKLRDRFLFQLGQWLEEPGETRDVRGAWKAYNEVVASYPLSSYWKAAGERAAYINRHFLQVR